MDRRRGGVAQRHASGQRTRDAGREEGGMAEGKDETCPVSTRGGTRLVRLVRGRGGGTSGWLAMASSSVFWEKDKNLH